MNREQIKNLLPHREPMLLLDQVEKEGENQAQAAYHFTGEEFFFQGHFPGNPVAPGVILCEIMAQACCILLEDSVKGQTPYFTGLDKVRFRAMVKPGDTLEIRCQLTKTRPPFYFAQGKGYIRGKLAVEGHFSFMLAAPAEERS